MTDSIYDVAIIGAGPAGLAAAEQILKHGGRVVVLDEQARAGGQIMRQPPKKFTVRDWLKGDIYNDLKDLLQRMADHPKVIWHMSTTVSGVIPLTDGFQLWLHDMSGLSSLTAKKIIICSGCTERPLAFPGATTPGVMGAGAIQTFLKSQQILTGENFVFAGTHPLQLIVAEQIMAAGGKVAAVAFAQPLFRGLSLLKQPHSLLSHWQVFAAAAKSLIRLKRAGVALLFGYAIKEASGGDSLKTVTLQPVTAAGKATQNRPLRQYEVDSLGLCYGFQAASELARQAGAEAHWSEGRGGWLITHSEWMESSRAGLYVAGELTGMAGGDASREEGHIAGIGCALALGLVSRHDGHKETKAARKRLRKHNRFARILCQISQVSDHLPDTVMTDDSLLCRCENVTCGTLKNALEDNPHLLSANSVKLLTRTGMGLCQGRLCYANTAALITRSRQCPVEDIGPFHANWPVRPLPVSSLIKDRNF